MSNSLSRRMMLRILPAAPAAVKVAAQEIAGEAMKATAIADTTGMPTPRRVHGGGSSREVWKKINDFGKAEMLAGRIPEDWEYNFRVDALERARMREDDNVEALLSISPVHRRRMHVESSYRAIVKEYWQREEKLSFMTKLKRSLGILSKDDDDDD